MRELGELLPDLREPPPGPRSRELAERLRAVESRNVTYLDDDFPIFWEEARGSNVRDADGNIYLDLTGAFGVAVCGHADGRVTRAIAEQAGRLAHGMGDVHPPVGKLELLERLADLSPWPETRTVLASTGSEAVEIALKTAALATRRPGVLAFEGGYHGLTLGALAATHRSTFRAPFRDRLYGGVAFAPFPECVSGGEGAAVSEALADVRRLLAGGAPDGAEIGAVLLEPIQGRAGVRIPPRGFLEGVVEAARQAGAVVVFDEVFTGFGRTGEWFAFQHEGAAPDLLCVGKALGGGLPLSACMGRREVMEAWPPSEGEALHTSTFLGHPTACAAGLAVLEELEARGLVARARELGGVMQRGLERGLAGVRRVWRVRGRGLLLGVEMRSSDDEPLPGAGARVAVAALARGVLVLPAGEVGHVVELAPPFVLTGEQANHGVEVLVDVIRGMDEA